MTMKVTEDCYGCLKGLVEKTVALSFGDGDALSAAVARLDELFGGGDTPPFIANSLLAYIKELTGAYDPFEPVKLREFVKARKAVRETKGLFEDTLEGALRFSALGNSTDYFLDDAAFDPEHFHFIASVEKIAEEIYIRGREVLILGDNVGDFFFDIKLMRYLEGLGKRVSYAAREHPVQNDLSLKEVTSFNLASFCDNIISTGTGEVGLRKADIKGALKDLWEGDSVVIAKGMGNYETLSEFGPDRPVIHVMKIKCDAVAKTAGHPMGSYIAILGGEENGR